MITAEDISSRLASFLGEQTDARESNGRICVLTPVEYPDCDAVTVWIEERSGGGGYRISDMAAADTQLIGYLGDGATRNRAVDIAARYDTDFIRGSVCVSASDDDLADACWRVAQASAAVAEVRTGLSPVVPPQRSFDDLLFDRVARRDSSIEVKRNVEIRGLSGHVYNTSLFVPSVEAVLEPITGRKSWDRAIKVYAEFGDLRQVNGYKLVAVLDDRDGRFERESALLGQVASVAQWSKNEEWIDTVLRQDG